MTHQSTSLTLLCSALCATLCMAAAATHHCKVYDSQPECPNGRRSIAKEDDEHTYRTHINRGLTGANLQQLEVPEKYVLAIPSTG